MTNEKIQSIRLNQGYLSLPKGLTWQGIRPFSLITGLNGAGKTHLLKTIFDTLNRRFFGDESIIDATLHNSDEQPQWDDRDIQYIKYDETLSTYMLHHQLFSYPEGDYFERYKECIVLLFLKEHSYYDKKAIIESIFPKLKNDNKDSLNGFFLKDKNSLMCDIQCILDVMHEEKKKQEQVKNHLISIINEANVVFSSLNKSRLLNFQRQLINTIYDCLCLYLPATSHFKKTTEEPVTVPSEVAQNKISDPVEKNIQELLDGWFRIYCENRQRRILGAFEQAQKDGLQQLSVDDILKLLPISPWDLLNKKIEKHGRKYGFKHSVKKPNIVHVPSTVICEFQDTQGNIISFENLSSGEKIIFQIILIACNRYTIGYLPKCLLLDEPDSHLHPSLAKVLVGMIQDVLINKLDMQVIMTTHQATTVALAPRDSIFEIKRNGDNISIASIAQSQAVDTLTDSLLVVAPKDHKLVFTEDMNDAYFYQQVFDRAVLNELLPNTVELFFIKSAIGHDNNKNNPRGSGGCTVVKEIVNRLRLGQVHSGQNIVIDHSASYGTMAAQKHFICGLIDKDLKDKGAVADGIYKIPRDELESFQFDPFFIVYGIYQFIAEDSIVIEDIQQYIDRFVRLFEQWLSCKKFITESTSTQKTKSRKKAVEKKEIGQCYSLSVNKDAFKKYFLSGHGDYEIFKEEELLPVSQKEFSFWKESYPLIKEFIAENNKKEIDYYCNVDGKKLSLTVGFPGYFVFLKGKSLKCLLDNFTKSLVGKNTQQLFDKSFEPSNYFPSDLLNVFQDIQNDGRPSYNTSTNLSEGSTKPSFFFNPPNIKQNEEKRAANFQM
ncbi:MAG: AAA family ATPase [Gammaproteobacteria bacterium]